MAQVALQTIEDFETPDTRFFSGYYLTVSRTNASDYVQRGHYAGKLDYVLPEDTGYYSQAMAGSFSNLQTPYTALNLWVYGDGSGNQLSFLYTGDIRATWTARSPRWTSLAGNRSTCRFPSISP